MNFISYSFVERSSKGPRMQPFTVKKIDKMKKHIILLCMLIFTTTMVQAQTKEQTIDWLKEKLTKYFQNDEAHRNILSGHWTLKEVVIDECEILFKCSYYWGFSGGTTELYNVVMPTQGLTLSTNDNCFSLNYEGIKKTMTATTYRGGSGLNETSSFMNTREMFRINSKGEVDLIMRIQKAITHLAEFCPAKPKEVF